MRRTNDGFYAPIWPALSGLIAAGIQQHEEGKPSLVWDTFGSHAGPGLNDGRLLLHVAGFAGVPGNMGLASRFRMYIHSPFKEAQQHAMRNVVGYCLLHYKEIVMCCPDVAAEALKAVPRSKRVEYYQARQRSCLFWLRLLSEGKRDLAALFFRPHRTKFIAKCMEWLMHYAHFSDITFTPSHYAAIIANAPPRVAASIERHYGKVAVLEESLLHRQNRQFASNWFAFLYSRRPDPTHPKWTNLVLRLALGVHWVIRDELVKLIPANSYAGKISSIRPRRRVEDHVREWFLLNISHPCMREEHERQFMM